MDYREVSGDREFLLSLSYGADWREEIERFAAEHHVRAAWFVGTGAVEDVELAAYDQEDFETESVTIAEPLEVAACVGSVGVDSQDDPAVHAHATLARASGQALAGRLMRATVFSGQVYLRAFDEPLEVDRSETTGRDGWAV